MSHPNEIINKTIVDGKVFDNCSEWKMTELKPKVKSWFGCIKGSADKLYILTKPSRWLRGEVVRRGIFIKKVLDFLIGKNRFFFCASESNAKPKHTPKSVLSGLDLMCSSVTSWAPSSNKFPLKFSVLQSLLSCSLKWVSLRQIQIAIHSIFTPLTPLTPAPIPSNYIHTIPEQYGNCCLHRTTTPRDWNEGPQGKVCWQSLQLCGKLPDDLTLPIPHCFYLYDILGCWSSRVCVPALFNHVVLAVRDKYPSSHSHFPPVRPSHRPQSPARLNAIPRSSRQTQGYRTA